MTDAKRVEVGFEGGQVIALRVASDHLERLRSSVGAGGWQDVETDDGILAVNLDKVIFLRIEGDEHRVGFSSGS